MNIHLIKQRSTKDSRVNHYREIKDLTAGELATLLTRLKPNHGHWARGRKAAAQDMLDQKQNTKRVEPNMVRPQF